MGTTRGRNALQAEAAVGCCWVLVPPLCYDADADAGVLPYGSFTPYGLSLGERSNRPGLNIAGDKHRQLVSRAV